MQVIEQKIFRYVVGGTSQAVVSKSNKGKGRGRGPANFKKK